MSTFFSIAKILFSGCVGGVTSEEIQAELVLIRANRTAIYKTGVSYSNGISLTRASLPHLQERESYLLRMLSRKTTSGVFLGDFR